jgi:mannose-6-phosphate isomerase-like protein (cupin superfamily)
MSFTIRPFKGIDQYFWDEALAGDPLRLHISQVPPGESSHPPHKHGGFEAFYMLEGEGALMVGDDQVVLKANQAAVFDPTKLHGLSNTGTVPMRYMVIIVPPAEEAPT